ncbi:hypothetical protein [Fusibacter bizertensis]
MFDYEIISDGIIDLKLKEKNDENKAMGWSPEYKFEIRLHNEHFGIGHLNIRIGDNEKIINYIGHIGYGINEQYRGNKYSLRACLLAKKMQV